MAESFNPMPNRFKSFATMTYSVSIYILSPKSYQDMMSTGVKDVSGLTLLLQSGGAGSVDTADQFGATRSKHFNRDYFIDDVQIDSLISGTATGAAHNSFALRFSIHEPAGLTFMDNLYKAIEEYNRELGETDVNYLSQTYLMVIRFYGYDKDGKIISGADLENNSDLNSDNKAYSEKWIPFMFTGVTFSLAHTGVTYRCEAVCPQSHIGTDRIHGMLHKNISIQGKTIEDILVGGANNSVDLVSALNNQQNATETDMPDEYDIVIKSDKIKNALLAQPGSSILSRDGIPTQDKSVTLSSESSATNTRAYSAVGGTSIVHFIDTIIRSSKYISDQFIEKADANKDNTTKFERRDKENLRWFKINPELEILGYDKVRHTWAYKVTYVIDEYEVKSVNNVDFANNECNISVHKEYDYWFTGKNTEVLEFTQEYNFLYFTSAGHRSKGFGEIITDTPGENTGVNNWRTAQVYMNRAKETAAGGDRESAEQAANAASTLYSPADQARAEIKIVGDPDWIGQSELFYAASRSTSRSPTMPDGSINYDISEVFFTINYNTVVDYDINSGLADTTLNNINKTETSAGDSQYSLLYRANQITTELSRGEFTQRLDGSIIFVPKSCFKPKREG